MSGFTYTDPATQREAYVDLTPVLDPSGSGYGIERAWGYGCQILAQLIMLMPRIENQHATLVWRSYQAFKAIPVNKKPGPQDQYNPGTDTYFKDTWLPATPEYQLSRLERDTVKDMIVALRMTYLPKLKSQFEAEASGERTVPSRLPPGRPPTYTDLGSAPPAP